MPSTAVAGPDLQPVNRRRDGRAPVPDQARDVLDGDAVAGSTATELCRIPHDAHSAPSSSTLSSTFRKSRRMLAAGSGLPGAEDQAGLGRGVVSVFVQRGLVLLEPLELCADAPGPSRCRREHPLRYSVPDVGE